MKSRFFKQAIVGAVALVVGALPRAAMACAVCYGASDAAQTRGMNMGMVTMLGVTGAVLASFGGMIFCFARRARRYNTDLTP